MASTWQISEIERTSFFVFIEICLETLHYICSMQAIQTLHLSMNNFHWRKFHPTFVQFMCHSLDILKSQNLSFTILQPLQETLNMSQIIHEKLKRNHFSFHKIICPKFSTFICGRPVSNIVSPRKPSKSKYNVYPLRRVKEQNV